MGAFFAVRQGREQALIQIRTQGQFDDLGLQPELLVFETRV
jgi:hypothetical protein